MTPDEINLAEFQAKLAKERDAVVQQYIRALLEVKAPVFVAGIFFLLRMNFIDGLRGEYQIDCTVQDPIGQSYTPPADPAPAPAPAAPPAPRLSKLVWATWLAGLLPIALIFTMTPEPGIKTAIFYTTQGMIVGAWLHAFVRAILRGK